MTEMEATIKPGEHKEARVSTTDPQATVMKMADGGFRPAYNVEYSTACRGQVIMGVDVVTVGSDQGQLPPMLDQIEHRFEHLSNEVLVDGGFANLKDIEKVQAGKTCEVYAPVVKPKKEGIDRHEPKATDSEEVAAWRKRMGTQEPRRSTKRERRRRSVSTPRPAIAASISSWFEGSKKSRPSRRGSPSLITWHAGSLSNRTTRSQ